MSGQLADVQAKTVERIVERIMPILAGHPPQVQGAALADLLAMWLAGHFAPKNQTAALRDELLTEHIEMVRELVLPNQKIILAKLSKGSS